MKKWLFVCYFCINDGVIIIVLRLILYLYLIFILKVYLRIIQIFQAVLIFFAEIFSERRFTLIKIPCISFPIHTYFLIASNVYFLVKILKLIMFNYYSLTLVLSLLDVFLQWWIKIWTFTSQFVAAVYWYAIICFWVFRYWWIILINFFNVNLILIV